jgi:phosphoadenosine phosphosulfate reductase
MKDRVMKDRVEALNRYCLDRSPEAIIAYVVDQFGGACTLASSLGAEDQVLTHMYCNGDVNPDIFMIDTGRLHQETYDVAQKSMDRYGFRYRVFFPQHEAVEAMVTQHGPNHFYKTVANRQDCCHVRKVAPLSRALTGYSVWMTGLRRAQSIERATMPYVEWDDRHHLIKVNPLLMWSKSDVWDYVRAQDVPVNALHNQGYPSIGCAPCTRAVLPGENDRSGRWWWEDAAKKECGLHLQSRESA